jgi:NADPH:quinone reductase-like Zn-dependent oxidoreductase
MSSALPETFKAYTYARYGPLEDVLECSQLTQQPLPSPSHVRVKVYSASLNPIDYKVVETYGAKYTGGTPTQESPFRIGFDFAGEVVEVGAEATAFKVGDSVYGKAARDAAGSLGEFLVTHAELLAHKPTTVDFDHAAGVPGVALTSYQALSEHAKLQPGERVLVLGGSSSTGIFGIQYAKALGAFVVATTSTKNVAFVQALGTDEVIDYRTQQWSELVEAHSIDVVYDCGVEPTSWEDRAQHVLKRDTGRFVTLRRGLPHSDAKFGATYAAPFARPSGQDLAAIATLIDAGKIKLFVDSVFPLESTREAFARLKTERAVGKVIVQVATP